LSPFTWLLFLVKYGSWYAAVLVFISFVALIKMLSPRPKRVMIDRTGALTGDHTILRPERSIGPQNHESHRRRRRVAREQTKGFEPHRGQTRNKRSIQDRSRVQRIRSQNTTVRKTFVLLPSSRPRGFFSIFKSYISRSSRQDAARKQYMISRRAKTRNTRKSQKENPCAHNTPEIIFKKDLNRCATANGVFALIEENTTSIQFDYDSIEITMNRLAQVGASRDDTKRVLALLKLYWVSEQPVDERVVKLRFDPASGAVSWNDKARTSILFERWNGRDMHDIMTGVPNLRISTLFNDGGRLLSWRLLMTRRVV